MNKAFLIAVVLISILILGCQKEDLPPAPGEPGTLATSGVLGKATGIFPGYAPAYDVFNNKNMIFTISDDEVTATKENPLFTQIIGAYQPGGYIWQKAYYYDTINGWASYDLDGNTVGSSRWIRDEAVKGLELDASTLKQGKNYLLAYSCKKYDGKWRCGCSAVDGPCSQWMLQYYILNKVELPPTPEPPGPVPEGYIINQDIGDYKFVREEVENNGEGDINFGGNLIATYSGEYNYMGSNSYRTMAAVFLYKEVPAEYLLKSMEDLIGKGVKGGELEAFYEKIGEQYVITLKPVREADSIFHLWVSKNRMLLVQGEPLAEPRAMPILKAYLEKYPSDVDVRESPYCNDNVCSGSEGQGIEVAPYCKPCGKEEICSPCQAPYFMAACNNDCTYGYCGDGRCDEKHEAEVCPVSSGCVPCKEDCKPACDIDDGLQEKEEKSYNAGGISYDIKVNDVDILENKKEAAFIVNGEETGAIGEGSSHILVDGSVISVTEININEMGVPVVGFCLALKKAACEVITQHNNCFNYGDIIKVDYGNGFETANEIVKVKSILGPLCNENGCTRTISRVALLASPKCEPDKPCPEYVKEIELTGNEIKTLGQNTALQISEVNMDYPIAYLNIIGVIEQDGLCVLDNISRKTCVYKGIGYEVENLGGCGVNPTNLSVNGEILSIMQGTSAKLKKGIIVHNLGAPCSVKYLKLKFEGASEEVCTDSDSGVEYYVRGITKGLDSNGNLYSLEDACYNKTSSGEYLKVDICSGAGCVVNEAYCLGSAVISQMSDKTGVVCLNGCSDGACIPEKCTEGQNKCSDDLTKVEQCVSGAWADAKKCSFICNNAQCIDMPK